MTDCLMALYMRFFPRVGEDPDAEAAATELRETLSKALKKLLLLVEDVLNARCEAAAFTAFVSGFRTAAGLAVELKDG